MIPVIEDIVQDILNSKFLELKSNPNKLDDIIQTSPTKLNNLKQFLATRPPVNVKMGFPRTPAELPAICILLSSESESQEGLGDYGDEDYITTSEKTENSLTVFDSDTQYSTMYIKLNNKPIDSVTQIFNIDLNTPLAPHNYSILDAKAGIISITDPMVMPGDLVNATVGVETSYQDSIGALYDSDYKIEIWTENGDLTIQLYHLVKWALLSGRDYMVKSGLIRQKLGGSDFEPALEYMPIFVYRRALTFWCQTIIEVPNNEYGYIRDVIVNQQIED